MPGNKLQGALGKSPSMAGMTRVSPGVYRDAQGKLVRGGETRQREEMGNNPYQQINGQPNQPLHMSQEDLSRFGPMQTLPNIRQGSLTPEMMQRLQQGFNTQQPQQRFAGNPSQELRRNPQAGIMGNMVQSSQPMPQPQQIGQMPMQRGFGQAWDTAQYNPREMIPYGGFKR